MAAGAVFFCALPGMSCRGGDAGGGGLGAGRLGEKSSSPAGHANCRSCL